ncbi:hypothetical protein Aph02nite_17310 [Actinoplanes philippinensis]|uniref:Uncharacterized protein n=1 Tax=Actinoplanes philippinensis TaxID=35752 RepID=A0A1I2B9R8_9ACTN|nr:hypothetical protein [Actinoplanes philippinensis]GIE75781.1 hypothetical protein Aph02nite_17310 [Actinoplanes philippinensis]SFE52904.1 hypothetical protein SAMN05421541_102195 [Actinoplanes philippinensis]
MTFDCTCDPAVVFDPPNRTPVAVADCTAHLVRRAVQLWIRRAEPETTFGWRCVEHPGPAECAAATTCRMRPIGGDQ